jgi:hypothetical protein
MQRARIIVGLLAASFLLVGCDNGGGDNVTASPDETKSAVQAALQKARPGPAAKGKTPASPSTK